MVCFAEAFCKTFWRTTLAVHRPSQATITAIVARQKPKPKRQKKARTTKRPTAVTPAPVDFAGLPLNVQASAGGAFVDNALRLAAADGACPGVHRACMPAFPSS